MTISEYVERLFTMLGVTQAQLEVTDSESELLLSLTLDEADAGRVIGHRGEALAALQRILRIIFQEELTTETGNKRLVLDINNYRTQREQQLVEMALQAAEHVINSGEDYVFPHMPSYERFLIHSTISEHPDFGELETESFGEGRGRRLVVRLKAE